MEEQKTEKINLPPAVKRKIDRIVFCGIVPVLVVAVLCLSLFSPPKLTMGDGYLFGSAGGDGTRSVIYSPGGDVLLGPAQIRLWGTYPLVFGTTDLPDCAYFILNLQEHTLQKIAENAKPEEKKEFEQILKKYDFQLVQTVDWKTLFRDRDNTMLRRTLKDLLSCPARRMFTGFSSDGKK